MPDALTAAARERSRRCLASVKSAVRSLQEQRREVSLKAVAIEARVSRNFIYSTPAALKIVTDARSASIRSAPRVLSPKLPTTSDDSLRTRLAAALLRLNEAESENTELRKKNQALIAEVIELQNPALPRNVSPLRNRRV